MLGTHLLVVTNTPTEAPQRRKGFFWLKVPEYSPSWWASHRSRGARDREMNAMPSLLFPLFWDVCGMVSLTFSVTPSSANLI